MSAADDWFRAYARQADADFTTWQLLETRADIPQCQKLLFLQMACEKLCKAHLVSSGTPFARLQTSHGFVANPLPVIIRQEISFLGRDVRRMRAVVASTRHLAQEIELLNPALERGGRRPDNCEYPWEDDGGSVHSPLDHTFVPSQLLTAPQGRTILKLIRGAINRLLAQK